MVLKLLVSFIKRWKLPRAVTGEKFEKIKGNSRLTKDLGKIFKHFSLNISEEY